MGGNACTRRKLPKVDERWWWDVDKLCQRVNRTSILFVVDSSAQQTFAALVDLIQIGGKCAHYFSWGHSDTLDGRDYGHMNRGSPWYHWVEKTSPYVAMFTVGAHIRNDTDYRRIVTNITKEFQNRYIQKRLIWATQFDDKCISTIEKKRAHYNSTNARNEWLRRSEMPEHWAGTSVLET
jgi:hypothetical protein